MNIAEKAFYFALARPDTLSIVNYHQVVLQSESSAPVEMDSERFAAQLSWLKSACNVLPLREANRLRVQGKLPRRAVVITFDDGYANNAEVALPLLKQAGLPATFFVCSEYLRGGRMWNDAVIDCVGSMSRDHVAGLEAIVPDVKLLGLSSRMQSAAYTPESVASSVVGCFKYLPAAQRTEAVDSFVKLVGLDNGHPNIMMSPGQLRQLRDAGMEIGGHTVNHPILASLPYNEVLKEVSENKQWLEECLDQKVISFAYPNGKPNVDYTAESRRAVQQAGFEIAVTTAPGVSTAQTDRLQLPRFTPWDRSRQKFLTRLLLNTQKRSYDHV